MRRALLFVFIAALAGTFGYVMLSSQRHPTSAVPIVWDKEVCAHCRMHIGDPHFAAQAQLEDGRVASFDDPGCMLTWLDANKTPVHALYVHDHEAERWLTKDQSAFVTVNESPMGFGLAAAEKGRAGAMSWNDASDMLRERRAKRGSGADAGMGQR